MAENEYYFDGNHASPPKASRSPEIVWWTNMDGKSKLREFTGLSVDYGGDSQGMWAMIYLPEDDGRVTLTLREGEYLLKEADGTLHVSQLEYEESWVSGAKDEVADLLRMELVDLFDLGLDTDGDNPEPDYLGIADAVVERLRREGFLRNPAARP